VRGEFLPASSDSSRDCCNIGRCVLPLDLRDEVSKKYSGTRVYVVSHIKLRKSNQALQEASRPEGMCDLS
jgi:hypothetical protein